MSKLKSFQLYVIHLWDGMQFCTGFSASNHSLLFSFNSYVTSYYIHLCDTAKEFGPKGGHLNLDRFHCIIISDMYIVLC